MMHTNLIKIFTCLLFFFTVCCFSQNIDTLKTKNIDEVTINQEKRIILKLSNGKYDINVVGTPFQEQTDAWEALKTIPILKVEDQGEILVFNKQLRLEINGILVQMPSNEIEGYIKNIDPKNIKNIEVTTTPNSSYSADIEAVINIVLNYKIDNYKIGLTSNSGIKTHFLSSNGINTTLSHKKFRGYLNYNYSYYQPVNNSKITYKILSSDTDIDSEERSKFNNHNIISNFEWSLNKKIKIVLAQDFSFRDNTSDISFLSNNDENILSMESGRDLFKFSQIIKYDLHNSNIRMGSQQVISNTLFNNYTTQQEVVTKVPITNYFLDYTNNNKVGETLVGIKIGNVISNNNTLNSLQNLNMMKMLFLRT